MSHNAAQDLYYAATGQMGPGYLIRESDYILLYVNDFIRTHMKVDPVGMMCHQAFMGQDAPCPFCPQRQQEDECYRWEYFSGEQGRLYSVNHRFLVLDGVPCRAGQAEDVSEIMHLSRSAMEYLSLTKFLSDMQARIIGNQEHTLEIIMEFLRSHFRAEQVAVICPSNGESKLYLSAGVGEPLECRTITGQEPELATLLAVPPNVLTVGESDYAFRLVRPANPASWRENRQAVLCVVQIYLENAQLRQRIEWDNRHDQSTTLYNRAYFMQMSSGSYQELSRVGVIFLDIDNLKKINDEHGHQMGDRLIKKAADVLLALSGDLVHPYRMGGDEFLLLSCDATRGEVSALLERVMEGLDTSNELIPMPQLSISAGWAYGEAPFRLEVLVTQADEMMYAVKRAKKAAKA